MEKEIKTVKTNPSLVEVGNGMHDYKKSIRSKGKRVGIVGGREEEVSIDERVTRYEDRRTYFKFFKGKLERISMLSKMAREMYFYILENKMEYGKHSFILIYIESAKDMKVSESTVSRAMRELLDEELIYKSDLRFVYFLNISVVSFCNDEEVYREFVHTVLR